MDNLLLILVHGMTVLAGVFVGYSLASKTTHEDSVDSFKVEPDDVPDSMIKKILSGQYFKDEEEVKETVSDKIDRSKRHAFYD